MPCRDRPASGACIALGLIIFLAACAKEPEISPRAQLEQKVLQGDAGAMFALAEELCCGIGEGKNEERAFTLYCQAARQGDPRAQFTLGRIYQEGGLPLAAGTRYQPVQVKKDNGIAIAWYLRAQEGGNRLAGAYLQLLSRRMNTTQMDRAATLAEEMRAIPCQYQGQNL